MSRLRIHALGAGVSVQDFGRPGFLAFGVSRGGAADVTALHEGAALLGQDPGLAALEMAGMGGTFEALEDMRIALTGAPMAARLDGVALQWNASHALAKGSMLEIGAVRAGSYGYVHFGGGIVQQPAPLGAQSTHFAAGLNTGALNAGNVLQIGPDPGGPVGLALPPDDRFAGGPVRCVTSLQTKFFGSEQLRRFQRSKFTRDPRANRMGVRLVPDGEGFQTEAGLSILSEVVVPGDIQITGDGTPFVLMCECQTTGGYPRMGSVIPADLPRVAQAAAGTNLQFNFVELDAAIEIERTAKARIAALKTTMHAMRRDPRDMPDLLAQQLISGVISGDEFDPA